MEGSGNGEIAVLTEKRIEADNGDLTNNTQGESDSMTNLSALPGLNGGNGE
jgi:hypothetical protein